MLANQVIIQVDFVALISTASPSACTVQCSQAVAKVGVLPFHIGFLPRSVWESLGSLSVQLHGFVFSSFRYFRLYSLHSIQTVL